MLEFKTIEIFKPNKEIIEIIKNYNYKTKNGKIKHLEKTNLQFIEPTEYRITKLRKVKLNTYWKQIYNLLNQHNT